MKLTISQERLKELLHYSPETGAFTWLVNTVRTKAGQPAGCLSNGYVLIGVDKHRWRAHRLAWVYVYGVVPTLHLDHINRNRSDNRISNLRECNDSENGQNFCSAKNGSQSGLIGASKWNNKWRSKIWIGRKQIHLGYFDSPAAAHSAYLAAKKQLHPFYSG